MRRFHFRLEKLLEIRKYREREWELKLAEITGICINLENKIQDLKREQINSFQKWKLRGLEEISVLKWNELYRERLMREAVRLQKILAEKERVRTEIRLNYQEAAKNRKILDKLKEKQQRKNHKLQLLEEMKAVDDMNMSNFVS